MKIFLKRALFLMCALSLVFGLVGCPTEPKNNNIGGGEVIPGDIVLYKGTETAGTAYSTIQAALDSIKDAGEYTIILQKGTYNENYINYNDLQQLKSKVIQMQNMVQM